LDLLDLPCKSTVKRNSTSIGNRNSIFTSVPLENAVPFPLSPKKFHFRFHFHFAKFHFRFHIFIPFSFFRGKVEKFPLYFHLYARLPSSERDHDARPHEHCVGAPGQAANDERRPDFGGRPVLGAGRGSAAHFLNGHRFAGSLGDTANTWSAAERRED
jgi:hypothetical protein